MLFRTGRDVALAALLILSLLFAANASAQLTENEQGRCRLCHSGAFASTASGPHSVLADQEWADQLDVDFTCTACHGEASAHIAAGGQAPIFAFGAAPSSEQSAVCSGCHNDDHPQFAASPHAQAGLSCTDCHSQHEGLHDSALLPPATDLAALAESLSARSAVCIDCHQEAEAQFALNERHRLREGILECTSCHDPHARSETLSLGGFRQQACMDCHADKGGPFVYEHGASRVEGCTACHSPHGSQNRHMLTYQRVGELCTSCHAAMPQFHLGFSPAGPPRFGLDTQCTNCHSAIHGSHFDPLFLR
ncbi:MAG: cytochrome c3 family protein [Gammaproteobacteria bacterium]